MSRRDAPGLRVWYDTRVHIPAQTLADLGSAVDQEYSMEGIPTSTEIGNLTWINRSIPKFSRDVVETEGDEFSATCTVAASYDTHVQVAMLLSWLCAAVRFSEYPGVSSSSVFVVGQKADQGSCNALSRAPAAVGGRL